MPFEVRVPGEDMLKTLKLPQPTWMCFNEPGGGDGGDAGGEPGGSGGGSQGGGEGAPTGVPQADVDRIVKGRVEETRKATLQKIQDELGVTLEEAKSLVDAARKKADDEKSDAQKARDAADAEKTAAEKEKSDAAQAKHDAKVERQLLRALPHDLEDEVLDKRVARMAKLIDVEVGADDEAIKGAIADLKKEWPEVFGAAEGGEPKGKGDPPPPGDPKGTPPKGGKSEDAFARGAQRAKELVGQSQYPILEKT